LDALARRAAENMLSPYKAGAANASTASRPGSFKP
jgi:hypothetical protein